MQLCSCAGTLYARSMCLPYVSDLSCTTVCKQMSSGIQQSFVERSKPRTPNQCPHRERTPPPLLPFNHGHCSAQRRKCSSKNRHGFLFFSRPWGTDLLLDASAWCGTALHYFSVLHTRWLPWPVCLAPVRLCDGELIKRSS